MTVLESKSIIMEDLELEDERIDFIDKFEQEQRNGITHSEDEIATYRMYVEEVAEEGDLLCLRTLAYDSLYGSDCFPQDYKKAEKSLLKLIDRQDDESSHATALGNIYFNGGHNDGIPDYTKAFVYYSLGSAGGDKEAKYRMAEMIGNGLGVKKNFRIRDTMLQELYYDLLPHMINGKYHLEFAYVAKMLGEDELEGVSFGYEMRAYALAYYYFLEAKYALDVAKNDWKNVRRMDKELMPTIEKQIACCEEGLNSFRQKYGHSFFKAKCVSYDCMGDFFAINIKAGSVLQANYRKLKSGRYSVTVSAVSNPHSDEPKIYGVVPELKYCGASEKFKVTIKPYEKFQVQGDSGTIIFDKIGEDAELFYREKWVGCMSGETSISKPKNEE